MTWEFTLLIGTPAAGINPGRRTAIGAILAGSGLRSAVVEGALLENVPLSATGVAPATWWATSTPLQRTMVTPLIAVLDTITDCQYALLGGMHSVEWEGLAYEVDELIDTNWAGVTPDGQTLRLNNLLSHLESEFAVVPIVETEAVAVARPRFSAVAQDIQRVKAQGLTMPRGFKWYGTLLKWLYQFFVMVVGWIRDWIDG